MTASRTVAFLGPAGTFTEAALHAFAAGGDLGEVAGVPVDSASQAFDAVRSGRADLACVAIENSVDGAVTATFDAFVEGTPLQIYREVDLPVAFAIMARPGTTLEHAATLATHPVAYQQIRGWLRAHAPGLEFVPASSNAAAAEAVARGDADLAAAPQRAAELFGLDVLARDVADVAGATTRFVLVGPAGRPTARTGHDRSSVIFTLPNEPGTLVRALEEFALRGVDLCRIESRPTRTGLGTYRFYVDIIGHIDDAPMAEALRALWLHCEDIAFVGSWPSADRGGHPPRDLDRLARADAWVARSRAGQ